MKITFGRTAAGVTVLESVPPGTPTDAGTSTAGGPSPAATCDSNLWNHVYHSYRLIVKQQCIAVTGTIVDATATQRVKQSDGVRHEGDGDTHGWLKVDPEFQNLLNVQDTFHAKWNEIHPVTSITVIP